LFSKRCHFSLWTIWSFYTSILYFL
jgi:hypothetical protein